MFFQQKKLRKKYDEKVLITLNELKKEWSMKKDILEKGIDNSEDVEHDFLVTQAKYFFYIAEAKNRKVRVLK